LDELRKNEEYTCEITGCTSEGLGVARISGRAVFVPDALPGEKCRVQLLKVGRSAVYARVLERLSASPLRMVPDCPPYGRCGGCDWRHVRYEGELEYKLQRVNDALARIGEGSGTTNCLTNSGVDEAWASGVMLANAVIELAKEKKPFTKENLEATYVRMRRASKMDRDLKRASTARAGFNKSFFFGMAGEGMCGMTGGLFNLGCIFKSRPPASRVPELKSAVWHRVRDMKALDEKIEAAKKAGQPLHDVVMDAEGWPSIPFDGELLMSHQDALLKGGKVQAAPGFADHVRFADPKLCAECTKRTCIEMCSAQALMPGENPGDPPKFDREKCVHCGACIWNCAMALPDDPEKANIVFSAGSGGLHSNEN